MPALGRPAKLIYNRLMTLTTHSVVGALFGAVAAHNVPLALAGGFASHFLLDAIPHWDYRLGSAWHDEANPMNNDIDVSAPAFVLDLAKIGFDAILGLGIIYALFRGDDPRILFAALLAGVCAMAPDPLQFVYTKFRREPLVSLQRFHLFMHAKTRLKHRPVLGITSQIAIIVIVVVLSHYGT